IEQDNIYNEPNDANVRNQAIKIYYCPSRRQPIIYTSGGGRCDYAGNGGRNMAEAGKNGMLMRQWSTLPASSTADPTLPPNQTRKLTDVPDRLSNTLLVGEKKWHPTVLGSAGGDNEAWNNSGWDQDHVRFGEAVPQPDSMHPTSASPTFWSVRFGGSHTGGFTAAMGDGSVRFIRYGIDAANWMRICLVNDGEVLNTDF